MSERWKPKKNDLYFFISTAGDIIPDRNNDDFASCNGRLGFGNYFRSRAEAEAAAEKVKTLLLSLHEPTTACSQLPKLTTEVFDRKDCPKWAKYAVVSKNGFCYFFEKEPSYGVGNYAGKWYADTGESCLTEPLAIFDATDWQNSLIERPAKLPDWCKVGEWCYCGIGRNNYTKIKKVLAESILAGEYDTYTADFVNSGKVLPARLRPYNAEEMRGLIGKVVGNEHGNIFLVTAFVADDGGEVCVDGVVYNADDLLECYTINDKPCGVLEHLENEEWVE